MATKEEKRLDFFISHIGENELIHRICKAKSRLLFASPGVSVPLAEAIAGQLAKMDGGVRIFVAADFAEAIRQGYGDQKGLDILFAAAPRAALLRVPGLRLGMLICDDGEGVVFAPPCRGLGEDDGGQGRNAAEIALMRHIFPGAFNGSGGEAPPASEPPDTDPAPDEQSIDIRAVTDEDIVRACKELNEHPAPDWKAENKIFLLAREFEFVEIKMTGYKFESQSVEIPDHLTGIGLDSGLQKRIHTKFRPFDEDLEIKLSQSKSLSGRILKERRREIEARFLFALPGYGMIIRSKNLTAFEKDIEKIKNDMEVFQEHVQKEIARRIKGNAEKLSREYFDRFHKSLPENSKAYNDICKHYGEGCGKKEMRAWHVAELQEVLKSSQKIAAKMKVEMRQTRVAPGMLNDPGFIQALKLKLPLLADNPSLKDLFEDAASSGK